MIDIALVLIVFAGLFAWYLDRMNVSRAMWIVALVGFVARVTFVLVDNVLGVFAGYGDASGYERSLWFVAEQWQMGVIEAPLHVFSGPGHGGYYEVLYTTLLAPIYFLFGREPVLVRLAMALLGALIVVNIYLIGRALWNERAGLWAGLIAAVFPYWIYLGGILYRDTLVILLFTWMVYYLLRWHSTSDGRALALSVLAAALGLSLRLENVPAVAALFGVALYTAFEPSVRQKVATALVVVGSIGLFHHRFGSSVSVDWLAGRRRWLARANPGSYLTDVGYETVPELVAFAPIGAAYFLLVPFPWQTVDALATIALFQNVLLWYPVLILAVLGASDSFASGAGGRITLPAVAFVLAGVFSYGLVEGNVGPAMRHRSQFQFVVFAFAGVALARRVRIVRLWARTADYENGVVQSKNVPSNTDT